MKSDKPLISPAFHSEIMSLITAGSSPSPSLSLVRANTNSTQSAEIDMIRTINRIGITFAAATIALFAGINGLRAQDQASMFADADGLEPPDASIAYEIPVSPQTMAQEYALWPQLEALLSDPDGMNAPDEGFAYALPDPVNGLAEEQGSHTRGLVFDADGLEPPDIGIAYEIKPVVKVIAEGATETLR